MPSSYSGPQPTPRIQVSRSGETPTTFDGSTPTTSTTFPPRRLSVMADTPIGNVMHEVDRRRRRRSSSVFDPTVQRPTLDRLAADALGGRSRSAMNGNTMKAKTTAAWSSVRLKVVCIIVCVCVCAWTIFLCGYAS